MIGINHPDTAIIADEYYRKLYDWLGISKSNGRMNKIIEDRTKDRIYRNMLEFVYLKISSNKENLILCKPDNIQFVINEFKEKFQRYIDVYNGTRKDDKKNTSFGIFKWIMEYFYEKFMEVNGYWLIEQLKIKSCPYCNRSYTFSISNDLKVRPEYDHFYPKSIYPYLALSFYNLIPSCPTCNHLKREHEMDLNPYLIDPQNNQMKFVLSNIEGVKSPSDIKISIKCEGGKGKGNVKTLGLEKLYDNHKDYVKEIMDRAVAYNESYYDSLIESFRGMDLKEEQIDNLIWGVYLDNDDLGKRPMSKLTRDILEQYGIK